MKYTAGILLFLTAIILVIYSSINSVNAEPSIMKMYFKDGKVDENGNKIYILDYISGQANSTSPVIRSEPTDGGANAVVTDTQILLNGAAKTPVSDNPNAYDIFPLNHTLDIKTVEAINGGQLNNYTLNNNLIEIGSYAFIETSPTTAILTQALDIQEWHEYILQEMLLS